MNKLITLDFETLMYMLNSMFCPYFIGYKIQWNIDYISWFLSHCYRGFASENPDLVQLKSLLAGLTLPIKTGSSDVTAEDKDGKCSVISKHDENQMTIFGFSLKFPLLHQAEDSSSSGSLPLVSISASTALSLADMTKYLKKISRGEAIEGETHKKSSVYNVESKILWMWKMNNLLLLSDVLDVLTEVDEKSKRNPEIIQYFVVSQRMCSGQWWKNYSDF